VNDQPAARVDETEVMVTRVFAAPREVVFTFWTDPRHLAKWWGPDGYENHDVTIETEVGGRWQLRMVHTESGAEVWVHGRIVELVAPEILALHMEVPTPVGLPPIEIRLRVRFHDHGEQTRVTFHQGPFATAEQREQTIVGWRQSFDVLDILLASTEEY
jgi:uncharacterized protein YndB with AHSA1/START domain